jgi:hypothetical protein
LYSSPNTVEGDNEDKMGAACGIYGGEMHIGVLVGKSERSHLKDLGTDGKIILNWI